MPRGPRLRPAGELATGGRFMGDKEALAEAAVEAGFLGEPEPSAGLAPEVDDDSRISGGGGVADEARGKGCVHWCAPISVGMHRLCVCQVFGGSLVDERQAREDHAARSLAASLRQSCAFAQSMNEVGLIGSSLSAGFRSTASGETGWLWNQA